MYRIPVFDGHCDTALWLYKDGLDLAKNRLHIDLERAAAYTPYAQVFAMFAAGEDLAEKYRGMLDNMKAQLRLHADRIALCTDAAEAQKAFDAGKAAAFLSVEGAELLDCSEAQLEAAYLEGIRIVTITWNFANALAGSNREGADRGLTQRGKDFIRRCQQLGARVDVSHLSDPAFWDVMEITQAPVLATHSNSRAVWAHPRNLTDDQFKAIAETGGTVGINLFADFLGENADLDTVIRHIEHFLELGGEHTVALGGDLDGCDRLPAGFTGVESLRLLYEALLARNYSQDLVDGIFFNNLLNVFR